MRRLFNRLAKGRCARPAPAICESLEGRRLLSASAGLTLNRLAHLSTYNGIESMEIATVSGPTIAALNTNYTGAGIDLGESLGGQIVANVQLGAGRSAFHSNALFTTTGSQDTLEIRLLGYAKVGLHRLWITLSENGTSLATLNERVRVLPLPSKGLTLHAVAGQEFVGIVGFLPVPLQSGQGVSIDWGDHTNEGILAETVVQANGQIAVEGNHTYAKPGKYVITVNIGMGGPIGVDVIAKEILSKITVSRR